MKNKLFTPNVLAIVLIGSAASSYAALPNVEERTAMPVMQVQRAAVDDIRVVEPQPKESIYEDNPTLNLLSKIDFLQQEVQELRGKFEEQSYQLEQMHSRQKDLYLDLDKRLREKGSTKIGGVSSNSLSDTQKLTRGALKGGVDNRFSSEATDLDSVSTVEPTSLDIKNAPLSAKDKQAERQAYSDAYKHIQAKDFSSAETALKSMLKSFPTGEHAPNAEYWLGELYLVRGDLDLAQVQFENVYQQYPTHQKAADALLKMGYVQHAKGQWKNSSELLSKVKLRFPNTTSARLAETRLEKMRQDGRI
jgi:tol-pal system protein YbgF